MGSDEAQKFKPAPDIIGGRAEDARVTASGAVMVCDTIYDVESAHNATRCLRGTTVRWNDPATLAEAEALYADPSELRAALDRAPFA